MKNLTRQSRKQNVRRLISSGMNVREAYHLINQVINSKTLLP